MNWRQYVAREDRKLAAEDGNGALLNRDESNRVFELVAESMAGNEEREAAVSDLEDAAEQAIVAELSSRKGLQKRLPVLRGLTGVSGDASSSRFQLQHELFVDQFLAGAIGHYLREGQISQFERMVKEFGRCGSRTPTSTAEDQCRHDPRQRRDSYGHRRLLAELGRTEVSCRPACAP
ncbi:hypothetical protein [Streptomyces sp. NPDC054958]